MQEKLKNCKGFTLTELLVSVAILSFVVVAFLSLFVNGTRYLSFSRHKSTTSSVTQSHANQSISQGLAVSGTSSVTTDIIIELAPSESITIEDVEVVTVTDSNGNQNSEIITIIP